MSGASGHEEATKPSRPALRKGRGQRARAAFAGRRWGLTAGMFV
jgi:hypothetical protein